EGSLYVFDKRLTMDFDEATEAIGVCVGTGTKTSRMQNCANLNCRSQLVVSEEFSAGHTIFCEKCADIAADYAENPQIQANLPRFVAGKGILPLPNLLR